MQLTEAGDKVAVAVETGNELIKLYIEKDIMYSIPQQTFSIDLNTAKTIVENRLKACEGNSYPLYCDLSKMTYVTKEAREYMNKFSDQGIKANAIVTTSMVSRVLVNTYLILFQPKRPTKIFDDKEKAVEWLKQFTRNK